MSIFNYLKNQIRGKSHLTLGFLLVTLLLFPLLVKSQFIIRVVINILIYIMLASSMNIINGFGGMFSIGHAGYYCVGAYTAAILSTRFGWSFWILLPLSGAMAGIVSMLLLGFPALRLRGLYFAMVTLGFSEVIRLIVLNWITLTRGPMGIPGIPFPTFFGNSIRYNWQFYYIILGIVVLMLFIIQRVLNSRIGRAWISIREDETAASAMGVEVFRYKLMNLFFATFWAGVAGCIYAFFARYISADSFTLDEGFSILAMVIVGGQGSFIGPILGPFLLLTLTEIFRGIAQYRLIIFGAAILIVMHLRPGGIAGGRMHSIKLSNIQEIKQKLSVRQDK